MKEFITAALLCDAASSALAAEVTTNFNAARIQVVEGKVTSTIGCDVLPSSADVAKMVLQELENQKAAIGAARQIALLPAQGKTDPTALKISFDVNVIYEIYNAVDGPRASAIEVVDKVWSGAAQVFPGEAEIQPWTADVGCGDGVTYAVQDIIKQSVMAVAKRMK